MTLRVQVASIPGETLEQAAANITTAIEAGDIATSKWLIERQDKQAQQAMRLGIRKSLAQIRKMSTPAIADHVLELALTGEITAQEAEFAFSLLTAQAQFELSREVKELRDAITEASEKARTQKLKSLNGHTPAWGGLKAVK